MQGDDRMRCTHNEQYSSPSHQFALETLSDNPLSRMYIQRRKHVIQQEYIGSGIYRASERNTRLLTAAERLTLLADLSAITGREEGEVASQAALVDHCQDEVSILS